MSDMAYCGSCGEQISADARFCKFCGADQAPFASEDSPPVEPAAAPPAPEPDPPVEPEPEAVSPSPAEPASSEASRGAAMRGTAERVAPGSGELLGELSHYLRTPGATSAALAALFGLGVCLAVGLVLTLVLPNASLLAVAGGSGVFKETMAQAVSFLQVNVTLDAGLGAVRTVPVLFVLFPVLGVAAGVVYFSARTAAMPPRERMLWATAAAVPFAFLMLLLAISVGTTRFDLFDVEMKFALGAVFLLGLLWGGLGGALGMLYVLRRDGRAPADAVPPRFVRGVGLGWEALRPLLLALLAVGVLGTAVWIVQVVREDTYREPGPRSTGVAAFEQLSYAGDHAIDILPLGVGASERLQGWAAIPIDIAAYADLPDEVAFDSVADYDLFDFSDTMPTPLFVPMLIVLIAIPALLALYAGFAVARRSGETRVERAAAWGALVGPVWAVTMVLLATLARKNVVGNPTGDSVFVAFLIGGAVLGAVGGFLATQRESDL